MNRDMCRTCQAGLPFALFVGRPLNRGLADVVLLVPFLYASVQTLAPCTALTDRLDGRENTPLLCLTLGMASLGVSWVGHLRGCNSHGGSASGRASEACGCPFAGRDRHGDPLHTDLCFWRLLLALCAIATPEAVLGEWVAMLLRQWIEPLRKLHR